MSKHVSKLESANVVAGFDSQDNADEALLELRLAGFPDKRIGYYYAAEEGRLMDLIAQYHRFAASFIWGIIGFVAGAGFGLLIARLWYDTLGPDLQGMEATCAILGALFLGTAGGMMGLWTASPGAYAPAPKGATPPYVMAVDAGAAQKEASEILHRRGGFDIQKDGSLPPAGAVGGH
jgi:hypothetical protein